MTVRGQPERLRPAVGGMTLPGQFDLVVAVPVGCCTADDLTPCAHLTAERRVATVEFEGAKADLDGVAGLEARYPG
ncbi:hypothetical protein ETAA1_58510 [Urbifossiella limnaea]|uniref:Uncharacterized protein n=1 Tax=Urbifossiella limnaea TaxID=2528023 RepID=A0A517Y243_9BACT|nr:hypothetical protein ETAA1_58510 [Urbifossiella limnaea]